MFGFKRKSRKKKYPKKEIEYHKCPDCEYVNRNIDTLGIHYERWHILRPKRLTLQEKR